MDAGTDDVSDINDINLQSNEIFQIIVDIGQSANNSEANDSEIDDNSDTSELIDSEVEVGGEIDNMVDINEDYISFISRLFNIPGLNEGSNINSILNSSLTDPNQNIHKNVISERGESQIELLKYSSDIFNEKTCPMTLLDFENGDDIARLPCAHIFGQESILKWLKEENASCPVCRKKIDSKEIKKDIPVVNTQDVNLPLQGGPQSMVEAIMSLIPMPVMSMPVMSIPTTPMPATPMFATPMLATNNSSINFINALVDSRLRREEENDIQRAILASLN